MAGELIDGTAVWSIESLIIAKVTANTSTELTIDKVGAKRIPSISEIEVDADYQSQTKRGDNKVKDTISYIGDGASITATVGRFTPDAFAYMTDTIVSVINEWATVDKDGFLEWGLDGDDMNTMPELVIIASSASGAGKSGNQHVCLAVAKVKSPPLAGMTDEDWTDFEPEFTWTQPENGSRFYRLGVSESKVIDTADVLELFYPGP